MYTGGRFGWVGDVDTRVTFIGERCVLVGTVEKKLIWMGERHY